MKRYFIFKDASSQKFWNIDISETSFTVNFGRLGTAGQTQEKSFGSESECLKAADKLIAEKTKKGYKEVDQDAVSGAKDEAKSFGLTYDDVDNGKTMEDLFKKILSYKNLPHLKHLTITMWEGVWEGEGCQKLIDWFIANKDTFKDLESLCVGEMESEDCELSWIVQGDYSKFWGAFPNLKHITLQGSNELVLGEIVSDKLESIEIISGGLPRTVIQAVTKARTPHLRKLNLYLGVEDYGFDGNAEDIRTLVRDSDFPELVYLGVCNSELQNEIAEILVTSKYAKQLETLDLSKGVLTDKGAEVLLEQAANLENLKFLDLSYHFVSEAFQKKLKQLPFRVDLSDPQEYDEEEDYYNCPMFTE